MATFGDPSTYANATLVLRSAKPKRPRGLKPTTPSNRTDVRPSTVAPRDNESYNDSHMEDTYMNYNEVSGNRRSTQEELEHGFMSALPVDIIADNTSQSDDDFDTFKEITCKCECDGDCFDIERTNFT